MPAPSLKPICRRRSFARRAAPRCGGAVDGLCDMCRGYVRENSDFVPYFCSATPRLELDKLPLGSRLAKRRPSRGRRKPTRHPLDLHLYATACLMLPA
ncbi:phosphoenolpyruvate carboxylase [Sodalis sp.]|uniref:phosphoenolpyruvate carboxylase n=1 Tax=Sodalis sp. (in: enterobacteria) TaxID=1898979 RepID=UPI003873A485